jgi:alkanesulfonate monooxygenase SsuD/methylene tetrahydromethanopterin reductase-like flavin-dependent oxidoreductase (luciferase family)
VRAALERNGRSAEGFPFVLGPSVHLDDDPDRACAEAAPAIAFQANQYRQYGTDPDKPRPPAITASSLSRADYLVGTPEQALERLQRLYDRVPYSQVSLWGRLPGLSHEQATRSLRLFAERVMPKLKQYAESRRRT